MTVGVLLLAAGRSRRYGVDKRLATLRTGQTLLRTTLAQIAQTSLPVQVCLRPDDDDLHAELEGQGFRCVRCDRARDGMGATLAQGMAALPEWDAVVVMLADMPWVQPSTVLELARTVTLQTIAVPVFSGQRGNPVAFGSAHFEELGRCQGDQGARSLVLAHASAVLEIPVDDAGILRDVDHPDDLSVVHQ